MSGPWRAGFGEPPRGGGGGRRSGGGGRQQQQQQENVILRGIMNGLRGVRGILQHANIIQRGQNRPAMRLTSQSETIRVARAINGRIKQVDMTRTAARMTAARQGRDTRANMVDKIERIKDDCYDLLLAVIEEYIRIKVRLMEEMVNDLQEARNQANNYYNEYMYNIREQISNASYAAFADATMIMCERTQANGGLVDLAQGQLLANAQQELEESRQMAQDILDQVQDGDIQRIHLIDMTQSFNINFAHCLLTQVDFRDAVFNLYDEHRPLCVSFIVSSFLGITSDVSDFCTVGRNRRLRNMNAEEWWHWENTFTLIENALSDVAPAYIGDTQVTPQEMLQIGSQENYNLAAEGYYGASYIRDMISMGQIDEESNQDHRVWKRQAAFNTVLSDYWENRRYYVAADGVLRQSRFDIEDNRFDPRVDQGEGIVHGDDEANSNNNNSNNNNNNQGGGHAAGWGLWRQQTQGSGWSWPSWSSVTSRNKRRRKGNIPVMTNYNREKFIGKLKDKFKEDKKRELKLKNHPIYKKLKRGGSKKKFCPPKLRCKIVYKKRASLAKLRKLALRFRKSSLKLSKSKSKPKSAPVRSVAKSKSKPKSAPVKRISTSVVSKPKSKPKSAQVKRISTSVVSKPKSKPKSKSRSTTPVKRVLNVRPKTSVARRRLF